LDDPYPVASKTISNPKKFLISGRIGLQNPVH